MEVVKACSEPGASVAAVALGFGLNANLVRQWLHGRGFERPGGAVALPAAPTRTQRFVPLAMPAVADARTDPVAIRLLQEPSGGRLRARALLRACASPPSIEIIAVRLTVALPGPVEDFHLQGVRPCRA